MIEIAFFNPETDFSSVEIESINYLLNLLSANTSPINRAQLTEVVKNSRLLLARGETSEIIGMASLVTVTIPTGRSGRIEDVVVHDQYRGQGIGKSLIDGLIVEAKNLGLKKIDLTSNPTRIEANKLYESLGFNHYETNVFRKVI